MVLIRSVSEFSLDPAEIEGFKHAFADQAARVNQHESSLQQVTEHLQRLSTSVSQMSGQLASLMDRLAPPSTSSPSLPTADASASPQQQPREPYIPTPARYAGDLGTCAQFLHQCSLIFSQQPGTYSTYQSKIAFIMSLLTGQVAAWSLAISNQNSAITSDYRLFMEEMKLVFDHPVKGKQAIGRLLDLHQGSLSVSQYAVEFCILAAESGWGDSALQAVFFKGLSGVVKDKLATRDDCTSLNQLIDMATQLDNRIRERNRERTEGRRRRPLVAPQSSLLEPSPTANSATLASPETLHAPAEEPMQLDGRAHLTPAERLRRMRGNLCLYCGHSGHFLTSCPELPKDEASQ